MRIRRSLTTAAVVAISLLAGVEGSAQGALPLRLTGLINDYSAGGGGPWHIHADWDLRVKGDSGKADFSAAFAMVRSDLWVVLNSADPADTEARSPHTHHVSVTDANVTTLPNGVRMTGMATVTGSGNPSFVAPIQVDITGGSAVRYSNIAVTFGAPASGHFGTTPLNGVVTRP